MCMCVRVWNLDGLKDFGGSRIFSFVLIIGSSLYRVGSAAATENTTVLQACVVTWLALSWYNLSCLGGA